MIIITVTACADKLSVPEVQAQLRRQALRIGLISKRTESCLRFCSESEAAALHCFDRTGHLAKDGEIFGIIDAGGGTVVSQYISLSLVENLSRLVATGLYYLPGLPS
jgi:hypothetical protein